MERKTASVCVRERGQRQKRERHRERRARERGKENIWIALKGICLNPVWDLHDAYTTLLSQS